MKTTHFLFVKNYKINRLFIAICTLLFTTLFSNCYKVTIFERDVTPPAANIIVTSVVVTDQSGNTNGSLFIGGKLQLIATIAPDNATNKILQWTSSNVSVATVSQSGIVTPAATATEGSTTTITATAQDGSNISGQYIVVINITRIPVTSITLLNPPTTYTLGEAALSVPAVEYSPADANDGKTITWSIDATNSTATGATIDPNTGLLDLSGVTIGNLTITATTANGISASYTLTINYAALTTIAVEDDMGNDNSTITFGDVLNKQLTASFNQYADPNTPLTWASSDNTLISVDADGLVTFAAGATTPDVDKAVTITATSGVDATISGTYTLTIQPKTHTLTLNNYPTIGGTIKAYKESTHTTAYTDAELLAIYEGTTVYLQTIPACTDIETADIIGTTYTYAAGNNNAEVTMTSDKTATATFATKGTLFTANTAGNSITAYTGTCPIVIIPTKINGKTININTIAATAFENKTTITSLAFTSPSNIISIVTQAFHGCTGLTSIDISETKILTITPSTFQGCSALTSITLPNSVTTIGVSAFQGCSSLTSVTIPTMLTNIGNLAFQGCSALTSITLPNSVTTIGVSAFQGCSSLTSVTLSNHLNTISTSAFQGCSSLVNIDIPSNVTTINSSAFANCTALTSVTLRATTAPSLANTNAFPANIGLLFHVPTASVATYQAATDWSTYSTQIVDGRF